MPDNARHAILQRLRSAGRKTPVDRPELPPLRELDLDRQQLKEQFMTQFESQGGIGTVAADRGALHDRLADICRAEGITRAMATEDAVLATLELNQWEDRRGVNLVRPAHYPDREAYTRAVFGDVRAGITGADFAVAESGSLIIAHDRTQPRLVSLAPLVHIAVLPAAHIIPTYDAAMETLFSGGRRPSQVTFITGPSMTADIQATMFKGMHGPQKIYAIVLD